MLTQYITSIGLFYKKVGFYLEVVWLWRISGGYSPRMMDTYMDTYEQSINV